MLSPHRGGSKLIAMRRATFVLASGLTAAVVVGGALFYGRGSPPVSVAPDQPEGAQPQETPSAATEANGSGSAPIDEEAAAQNQQPSSSSVNDEIRRLRTPVPDEATLRADIREEATKSIRASYSLLLEDLDASAREKGDLEALLVEMQVEGTWAGTRTYEIRGRTIPQQERYERIAAVIGDQKLLEFLVLEENLAAYGETGAIASWLRRRADPLTETQRDGVLEILVEVRERYPITPSPDLDRNSFEYVQDMTRQLDEYDRHIMELAPSVLSPTQAAHLFDAYQRMSYERASNLERQQKWRAINPGRDLPWSYPGRWSW